MARFTLGGPFHLFRNRSHSRRIRQRRPPTFTPISVSTQLINLLTLPAHCMWQWLVAARLTRFLPPTYISFHLSSTLHVPACSGIHAGALSLLCLHTDRLWIARFWPTQLIGEEKKKESS